MDGVLTAFRENISVQKRCEEGPEPSLLFCGNNCARCEARVSSLPAVGERPSAGGRDGEEGLTTQGRSVSGVHSLHVDGEIKALVELCGTPEKDAVFFPCVHIVTVPRGKGAVAGFFFRRSREGDAFPPLSSAGRRYSAQA